MTAPIKLRPHHLLCLLTFAGDGYSPEFISNLRALAQRIATGKETVTIVAAPDDICAPQLCHEDCHCYNTSVTERDNLAAAALGPLLHTSIVEGALIALTHDTQEAMRRAFAAGTIRKACTLCPWSGLCTSIAENNFVETTLKIAVSPTEALR